MYDDVHDVGDISQYLYADSDVNICTDFVGRFSACYGGRPRELFLNLCFGVTFTFKLIAVF